MKQTILLFTLLFMFSCNNQSDNTGVSVVVLGNVQDAGSPQIACKKACCDALRISEQLDRMVSSLGILDYENNECYLLDASPDITEQIQLLSSHFNSSERKVPKAIFLSHAHIGHYTGLMYLGREGLNADSITVYAMPRMKTFLKNNGPWSQLYQLGNIKIQDLQNGDLIKLSPTIYVEILRVPHRDEFSETIAFKIHGQNKIALYIPDIDKWHLWDINISSLVQSVHYAFLDATFFSSAELPGRNMEEIPHPFVVESMDLFDSLDEGNRNKIYFIHLNHSNPLLNRDSKESKLVESKGYHIARLNDTFRL